MATSPDGQLTFEQVLERVLAADPESFYVQAQAFDEAAKTLHDAKSLLSKHRRTLEDAWANDAEQRFVQLDGLVRHLEVLLGDVPTYPVMMRRIGDAIVDSRQRLLDLQHMPPNADKNAESDRDKQARKILDDLSGTYRRVGGEMPELPERTASGQLLTAPPPRHAMTFGGATGGDVGCAPAVAKQTHSLLGRTTSPAVQAPTAEPVPQATFGRFAQYATRPAPSTAPAPKARSFNGFARLTDQADPAALALRPAAPGVVAADAPEQRKQRHAETAEVPVELDRPTKVSTVDVSAPVKLEVSPASTASAPAAIPATSSAPAAPATPAVPAAPVVPDSATAVRSQISLTSSSTLASVPTAPSAPAAPPAPPAPPVIPAAPGPQPHPLAVSATTHFAPDANSGANMMRPALGGAVPPSLSGPVGRGAEVWLRGDSTEWTVTHPAAAQPGRDGNSDHRLGHTGDRNAAEQGKDAR